MRKRLGVQRRLFENECFLLLGHIFRDEGNALAFLEGYAIKHEALKKEIDERFEKCIGDSYATCCDIVRDIEDSLRDMQHDLECFVRSESRQRNRVKETARHIQQAVVVAFEKDRYLRKIDCLNELRLEFAELRSQIEEMQKNPPVTTELVRTCSKRIPEKFGLIREASSTLHEGFAEAWNSSCDEAAHMQHTTILCLDVKVDDSVRLDLGICSVTSNEMLKQR